LLKLDSNSGSDNKRISTSKIFINGTFLALIIALPAIVSTVLFHYLIKTNLIVTIFAGANDVVDGVSADDFEKDLATTLEALSKMDPLVAIANLPDLTQLPRYVSDPDPDVTPTGIAQYNAIIAAQAARFNMQLVNLFAQPVDPGEVAEDGFHPSNEGHERLATLFMNVISSRISEAVEH